MQKEGVHITIYLQDIGYTFGIDICDRTRLKTTLPDLQRDLYFVAHAAVGFEGKM